MPLVYDWLKHAEATRRTISENYKDKEGEDLLQATIEENVPPSLRTCGLHPVIHSDFTAVKSISMPGSITLKQGADMMPFGVITCRLKRSCLEELG